MGAHLPLTERDSEILETLARRVRVLTLEQIARFWWPHAENARLLAGRRIEKLATAAYVLPFGLSAHPEIFIHSPVVRWQPGEPTPDLGGAAYRLQSRWTAGARLTRAVIASKATGYRYGGHGGRFPRPTEGTHDIHLAAVYLRFRQSAPELARGWTSEEAIRRSRPTNRGLKLPDALIVTSTMRKVIEFGGSYSREKLASFHEYCSEESLPYEVW